MKKSLNSNTSLLTTPVLIVGTYDENNKPNLMTAAWGGICCSEPKCISISLRKATYSYDAILKRKAFTVGTPDFSQVKEADYVGMYSGKNVNKFEKTGFTPVKSELVDAPYAKEIPVVLECKLINHLELGLHTVFIGQIMDVKVDESVLNEAGKPDMEKIHPFVFNSFDRQYYEVNSKPTKAFSPGKELL
jgi:flavin reductase (DIM6/NTAB) family NADH-FMN oxidoreductase RutF